MAVRAAAGWALLSAAAATPWHQLAGYSFDDYQAEFGRQYDPAELPARQGLFEAKLREIQRHNANPHFSWKRGVNHFTDRTAQELDELKGVDRHLLYSKQPEPGAQPPPHHLLDDSLPLSSLPDSVDWRTKGVITPVKNQGSCGSCWTFASTETLESHLAIKKPGMLQELSEQFVLDCTPNPHQCGGTGGCAGGTGELVYGRLSQLAGIPSEWTYPYTSGLGKAGKCRGLPLPAQHPHTGEIMSAANVTGHVSLPSNEYAPMMKALATVGPLAISVDAGGWHDYETGIYSGACTALACSSICVFFWSLKEAATALRRRQPHRPRAGPPRPAGGVRNTRREGLLARAEQLDRALG